MHHSHFEMVYNQITEGIKIKVNRKDDEVVMTEIVFKKGALFPEHIHLSDHSGYLLKGRIRISREGSSAIMQEGDSWCIGKRISHFTEAIEDSVVIEVYSPDESDFEKKLEVESAELNHA